MKLWISTAALLLALTACGGSDDGGGGGDAKSAMDSAAQIQAGVESVTKVVEITEDNDPNDSIGRPNQYTQAVSIYDSRATCESELDISCGAKIEVWDSESDAQDRADYLQEVLKEAKILGSEYDYVDGNVILRVSGDLKPTEAEKYEVAFTG